MAEVVGVVSAGIGVAAFALQVNGAIKRLRDIREYLKNKAGEDTELLIRRLEVLRLILLSLDNRQSSTTIARAVENCQSAYSNVDTALQKATQKLSNSIRGGLRGLRQAKDLRTELEGIGRKLGYVVEDLTLSIVLDSNCEIYRQFQTAPPLLPSPISSGTTKPDKQLKNVQPVVQATVSDTPSADTVPFSYLKILHRRNRPVDCRQMHCYCSCHSQKQSSARSWMVEYTPLSAILGACSNSKCTGTCYRWNLQFALANYGIPFKVDAAIAIFAGGGILSLKPSLEVERVVTYTSPGFETLRRFQCGLLSVAEFQDKFRSLRRCDPSFHRHINPSGRNYIQELLRYGPGRNTPLNAEFEVLQFFVDELGMTLQGLDQSFLAECVNWIYRGPHLDLLEAILKYGFDPGFTKSPFYAKWPSPCLLTWFPKVEAPDPFFVSYLALLAAASPGFAGLTPLHEMVLLATPELVASFISRYSFHMERNFLGQTPLHLAVRNIDMVRLLLSHGHNMDITDSQGITALMYAAGMGKTNVVKLLIEKGANPFIRDAFWKMDFIGFADGLGDWDMIMDALSLIQNIYPSTHFQHFLTSGLMRLIFHDTLLGASWSIYFAKLVSQCSDTNMKFSDKHCGTEQNNLLHSVSNCEDVRILVKHGFKSFNQPNSVGKTALFSLARRPDAKLSQLLVDYGVNVNHVDHDGLTVLFTLLDQLRFFGSSTFDIMDSINVFLGAGLDIFLADGCRCPCSPNGCFLPAAFHIDAFHIDFEEKMWFYPIAFVWALEFFSLVEETRGCESSKEFLLALLRRLYSDRVEINHVCCHRGHGMRDTFFGKTSSMLDEDIDEILEDEEEFIAHLEEEMVPLAFETVGSLRSKWISLLRERYNEQLAAMGIHESAIMHAKEPIEDTYEVNTGNHTFNRMQLVLSWSPITPVSECMADYIIWLEHQYTRSDSRVLTACEKEAWYNRRMTWFVELMQVMEVDIETFAESIIHKIATTIWDDKHRPNIESVVGHFTASVVAILEG